MTDASSRPLHIVLVGDYPADPRLGSPRGLFKLRDEFTAVGHRVTLLLRDELGGPHQRHARDAIAPWLAARAVRRITRSSGAPDVIDASSAEGWLLGREGAALVARSHGLEHLNYARMLDDARYGLVRRPWYRRVWYPAVRMRLVAAAARKADRLIVLNEGDRRFAAARGWKRPEEIDVVPQGIPAAFLARPAVRRPERDLLFCGSWDRVKGIDYLAPAFAAVVRQRPGTTLTILGPGFPESAVLETFDPGVRPLVRVIPRAPEETVLAQYRAHRAFVQASTFEGFGTVVIEAMAQGLPVIATPVGAAATVVRDGETGLVAPPRDAAALASAMLRALQDERLAQALGDRAAAEVAAGTWTETARRTLDVYRRAIAMRLRPRAAA